MFKIEPRVLISFIKENKNNFNSNDACGLKKYSNSENNNERGGYTKNSSKGHLYYKRCQTTPKIYPISKPKSYLGKFGHLL